jgi:hypothetical protein
MPRDIDPGFGFYTHLQHYPNPDEALRILKRVASLVKPLMRAHGWRVPLLTEMYPDQPGLLGLNHGLGRQILLRLREAHDRTQFLPFEKMADVMLHELAHMDHGPHSYKFIAMWNQLREELDAWMKGYTGKSFFGRAQHLGGRNRYPLDETRYLAEAEGCRVASGSSDFGSQGYRLGTSVPPPGQRVRNVALESFERRNRGDTGCANNNRTQAEIQAISQTAMRNAFRTRAEENATNEAAMAQAMWELMQKEKRKYGNLYMSSDVEDPFGSNRGPPSWRSGGLSPPRNRGSSSWRNDSFSSWRNDSYLYGADFGRNTERLPPLPTVTRPPARPRFPETSNYWACSFCTRRNDSYATACESCRFPRPGGLSWDSPW